MPGTRRKSAVREAGVQRSTRLVERQGMGDAWAGVEECDEATARSRAASGSGRALDVFAGADSGGSAAVLDEFLAHACSLDSFLQPSPSVAQLLRRSAKVLFDTSTAGGAAGDGSASAASHGSERDGQLTSFPKSPPAESQHGSAGGGPGAGLLRELYVDGFEVEQIWLQVELLVRRLLQRAQRLCKRMPASFALYRPELDADLDTLLGLDGDDAAGGSEADSEIGEDDNENGESEGLPSGGSEDGSMGDGAEPGGERDDAALEADAKEGQVGEMPARKRGREVEGPRSRKARKAGASERSLVEDRFFNLDELDRFLQQAEREEQELREEEEESSDEDEGAASRGVGERGGRDGNNTEEEEEEEEALDVLLQQANEHAGRKPGAGKADGVGGGIMARDFFDDVGSTGSEEEDQLQEQMEEEEEEEEDEVGGEEGSDDEGAGIGIGTAEDRGKEGLSAYERRVAALKETIQVADVTARGSELGQHPEELKNLEEAAMGEQLWQLRGEIQGKQRPLDSALELDMDFESSMPPPPAPTEATTTDLEEMIKRRIAKDEFDDVVKMELLQRDGRDSQEARKENQLDDSKNTAGLGKLYERDFLRAAVGGEAEDRQEPIRRQVRQLFRELGSKLDALSHFHFVPKPVIEELKVTPSAPAIAMEEVAPATVSTADQRAPEEVFQHQAAGTPAAEEELSREERKRRRAKKKREGMKAGAARAERRRQQQLVDAHTDSEMVPASQKRRSHLQKGSKTKVGNVFKQLQDAKEQPAAAAAAAPARKKPGAANLKL